MSFFSRLIAIACALCMPLEQIFAVVGEDTLPPAQWISDATTPDGGGTAFFRKSFTAPPQLARASVLAACDARMSIWLNGAFAGDVAGFSETTTRDVSAHLRPGLNTIAVRVENGAAVPAFRILLEMATDHGRQTWIVSDASWVGSRVAAPGWEKPQFDATRWAAPMVHAETVAAARWPTRIDLTKSPDLYNSWKLASKAERATEAAAITAPAGFVVELLRSASPEEGSWIALAFDPRGRLTIAREKRGLLRLTFESGGQRIEVINDTLLECRGLLYAHGALYVNANNSKGFYRLRDTDGDDAFDEQLLLLATSGGVGHGRNHVVLGPDGLIYLVHGNDVELPVERIAPSPFAHFAPDQLFPMRWGEHGTTDFVRPPHGHILQTDRDGKTWRLLAGGLRNALDVAFHPDGEMFAFDADNERDIAAPWYRPTRVLHVVPGAEFGWRAGAGKWPPELPDSLPAAVDIGIGSPCGIEFGTHSNFPSRLRRALFIADWAYGRILAVHLQAEGASYRGTFEPFVVGRPLNVTDLAFGPDGAMYFTTGGRGTQAGLYRVRFTGKREGDSIASPDPAAARRRAVRRELEKLQGGTDDLDTVWAHLGDPDRWIRHASRVALESRPVANWRERAFAETDPDKLLTAMLALARVGIAELHPPIIKRIAGLPLAAMSSGQKLAVIRVYQLSCARAGRPARELATAISNHLDPIYPAGERTLDHELCRLLVYLESPHALRATTSLLRSARTPEDLLHYLWHLRFVRDGWTDEDRRITFDGLRRAERHQGARDYLQALRDVRRELTAALPPDARTALGDVTQPPAETQPLAIDTTGYRFVKSWTIDDFAAADLAEGGSAERGRVAFAATQCGQCHRMGGDPGGAIGPDLAGVGARFGPRDLLRHILEPSLAIDDKFRNHAVTLKDGATYLGAIESEDAREVRLATGPGADAVISLRREEIVRREPSPVSPMPPGLLNILSHAQIVDLLAYLRSATLLR